MNLRFLMELAVRPHILLSTESSPTSVWRRSDPSTRFKTLWRNLSPTSLIISGTKISGMIRPHVSNREQASSSSTKSFMQNLQSLQRKWNSRCFARTDASHFEDVNEWQSDHLSCLYVFVLKRHWYNAGWVKNRYCVVFEFCPLRGCSRVSMFVIHMIL